MNRGTIFQEIEAASSWLILSHDWGIFGVPLRGFLLFAPEVQDSSKRSTASDDDKSEKLVVVNYGPRFEAILVNLGNFVPRHNINLAVVVGCENCPLSDLGGSVPRHVECRPRVCVTTFLGGDARGPGRLALPMRLEDTVSEHVVLPLDAYDASLNVHSHSSIVGEFGNRRRPSPTNDGISAVHLLHAAHGSGVNVAGVVVLVNNTSSLVVVVELKLKTTSDTLVHTRPVTTVALIERALCCQQKLVACPSLRSSNWFFLPPRTQMSS